MLKSKTRTREGSMLLSVSIGLGAALLITLLLVAAGAAFILNEYLEMDAMKYISILTQFLSVIAGSFLAGRIISEKKMLSCISVSGIYFLLLSGIAMLFFDGVSEYIIFGFLAVLIGCLIAIMLCTKEKMRSARKRRGRRYR